MVSKIHLPEESHRVDPDLLMSTGALAVLSEVPAHQLKRLKSDEAEQRLQEDKFRQQWASVEHMTITVSFELQTSDK